MAPSGHTIRILYASGGGSAPLPLPASLLSNSGAALARHSSRSDERSPEGADAASNQRSRAPGSSGRAEDGADGVGEGADEPIDVDEGVEEAGDGADEVGVGRGVRSPAGSRRTGCRVNVLTQFAW